MASRRITTESLRERRELRLRIARSRRRIDDRVIDLRNERARLTDWRTYVRRFPIPAIGAAFAVGLAASTAFSPRRIPKMVAAGLLQTGLSAVQSGLWQELLSLWPRSNEPGSDQQ